MTLSQFSGTDITPSNASIKWRSSPSNPHRTSMPVGYTERIDAVIVNMLARGSVLSRANYLEYLGSLHDGVVSLGNKPEYANDVGVR